MIKLTVNPNKEKKVVVFDQEEVFIGSSENGPSSLVLDDDNLDPIHLRISKRNDRYIIYNLANDPYSTVNQAPFGRFFLKNFDLLEIRNSTILFEESSYFEEVAQDKEKQKEIQRQSLDKHTKEIEDFKQDFDHEEESKKRNEEAYEKLLEKEQCEKKEQELSIDSYSSSFIDIPKVSFDFLFESNLEPDAETNEDESIFKFDDEDTDITEENKFEEELEALYHQFEKSHPYEEDTYSIQKELLLDRKEEDRDEADQSDFSLIEHKRELKNLQSRYTEEDPENFSSNPKPISRSLFVSLMANWKMWTALSVMVVLGLSIISSGVYLRLEEKNQLEEIQAAKAVSDVALALTYAQIHNMLPQQKNWTDPHFLKNSIYAVLTSSHQPLASIDTNGRLNGGDYLLRIYTNRDITRFVVIAQPEPSLLQWLSPQNAVVIDSKSMVLHLIKDLKPLNRLLVNPNSLSGENGREISEIVNNERILPLKKLADQENTNGFLPPRQLELLKSGAENYVYNAPRYSQVGELLMEQAIDLVSRPGGTSEIKKLQDELTAISRLSDPVLYTSKGMKMALKAQKALASLVPDQRFLIAYLTFDQHGAMRRSHLIIDPDEILVKGISRKHEQPSASAGTYQPLVIAAKAPEYIISSATDKQIASNDFSSNVDKTSTLFLKLELIAKERVQQLKSAHDKLSTLINENMRKAIPSFSIQFKELMDQYVSLNEQVNDQSKKEIRELYSEYEYLPFGEFENYLQAVGLKDLSDLQVSKNVIKQKIHFSEDDFNEILDRIMTAEDFAELNEITSFAYTNLQLRNVSDTSMLIQYQYRIRSKVLEKLNEMILSPKSYQYLDQNQESNRLALIEILNHSWVINSDEQNYYLDEYDRNF